MRHANIKSTVGIPAIPCASFRTSWVWRINFGCGKLERSLEIKISFGNLLMRYRRLLECIEERKRSAEENTRKHELVIWSRIACVVVLCDVYQHGLWLHVYAAYLNLLIQVWDLWFGLEKRVWKQSVWRRSRMKRCCSLRYQITRDGSSRDWPVILWRAFRSASPYPIAI